MTYFIGVASLKGGVTKTTTAVHLATFFARRLKKEGKRVELIDLDPQLSAYEWDRTALKYGQGMEYETIPARLSDVEDYQTEADIVIFDVPPLQPRLLEATAQKVDLLIIPTQPSGADISRVWKTIRALPEKTNIRILLTRVTLRSVLLREAEMVFGERGVKMFTAKIKERQQLKRNYGRNPAKLEGYEKVGYEIEDLMKNGDK